MFKDLCDQLAAREQLQLLRDAGFGRLLDAIENDNSDDSIFFPTTGRLIIGKLAEKMGTSNAITSTLLADAQLLLDGRAPWPTGNITLTQSRSRLSLKTTPATATAAASSPASI